MDLTIKIGGEAGFGIQTVGNLLALTCREAGLFLMAINDFESRIRGGHSFFQLRISDRPVHAPHHRVNLLVALDRKSYEIHRKEMLPESLVLVSEAEKDRSENVVPVSFGDLAEEAGGKITSNTVAAGACLSLLGAPLTLFQKILSDQFAPKGNEILNANLKAAELGYGAVRDISFRWSFDWKLSETRRVLLEGAEAFALGALAGDCRLGAFYPMSPATGIMVHLSQFSDSFPLVVEQAEDEIAAINMAIGASFAGVRAMTATSGGGFSLMVEGLGLAAMTETPVVIINAQRPGPATGLPTRTAQADLNFVINASQDEFPRFVFAPGNPEDAYETTARAFYLSEKYQVPAIILSDQYLNDSLFVLEGPLAAPEAVERFVIKDDDIEDSSAYKRFRVTPSGISPRALPGEGETLVIVSSDEHREGGHISETIGDRIRMVDKRKSKLADMCMEVKPPQSYYDDCDIVLVGWGSTEGAIKEAVDVLRNEGVAVGSLHFTDLWPFPDNEVKHRLEKKHRIFMVEQNAFAQLGRLIRQQTGIEYSEAILKYDGRPFYPIEIVEGVKKQLR